LAEYPCDSASQAADRFQAGLHGDAGMLQLAKLRKIRHPIFNAGAKDFQEDCAVVIVRAGLDTSDPLTERTGR
jgi:hypothetical protein